MDLPGAAMLLCTFGFPVEAAGTLLSHMRVMSAAEKPDVLISALAVMLLDLLKADGGASGAHLESFASALFYIAKPEGFGAGTKKPRFDGLVSKAKKLALAGNDKDNQCSLDTHLMPQQTKGSALDGALPDTLPPEADTIPAGLPDGQGACSCWDEASPLAMGSEQETMWELPMWATASSASRPAGARAAHHQPL